MITITSIKALHRTNGQGITFIHNATGPADELKAIADRDRKFSANPDRIKPGTIARSWPYEVGTVLEVKEGRELQDNTAQLILQHKQDQEFARHEAIRIKMRLKLGLVTVGNADE